MCTGFASRSSSHSPHLSAQVVGGVVRDSASGEPAPGVLVALVERSSGARRVALTDEEGRFTVASSGAGSYTLETKRVGVRPSQTPEFSLGPGEARDVSRYIVCNVPPGRYRFALENEAGEMAQTDIVVGAEEIILRALTMRRL